MRTAHVALLTAAAVLWGAQPPVWNRTYRCLFVHGGEGEPLDPLLWARTRYLLTGTSHRQALACLDEFLRSHAERAVPDPVERAFMQRELWAVFDWVAAGDRFQRERRELETRLAEAIRRLELALAEVRTLPDNYAAAVSAGLLPDLFHADGAWICLSAHSTEPTAIVHLAL